MCVGVDGRAVYKKGILNFCSETESRHTERLENVGNHSMACQKSSDSCQNN